MFELTHTIGDHTIPIRVRRNARARRLILRQDLARQQFVLTAPTRASTTHMQDFLQSTEGWILKKLALQKVSQPIVYEEGVSLSILGETLGLSHQPHYISLGVQRQGDCLEVHGPQTRFAELVEGYIKRYAVKVLAEFCQGYAGRLNVSFAKLTVKNTKSRWGSCSSDGAIALNWRLIFAPLAVARYVCAHEVAHLLEMNHSPAFWQLVSTLEPDYQVSRQWLKKHGAKLHLYGA